MITKNFNIKITDEEKEMIDFLRKDCCINISQFIRKSLREKFEEIKNGKKSL